MKTPYQLHEESLDPNSNNVNVYNNWAKTYDNYVDSLDYMGPKNIVKNLLKLLEKEDKTLQILDFGCGTDKVGEELRNQFNSSYDLEGIDISPIMLKNAEKKNVYNELNNNDLTKESYNKKFDIILSSGVFLRYVNINNISRLQKLLNKHGILLFTIRKHLKIVIVKIFTNMF